MGHTEPTALMVRIAEAQTRRGIALFEAFYRSGALVFGGGHVVLPLLRGAFVTPGWVRPGAYLSDSEVRSYHGVVCISGKRG
jgi:hypothetical protein